MTRASGPTRATVAAVDVHDAAALRAVLQTGRRAFLLNPPAAPAHDAAAEELETVHAIARALQGSGLQHVVAESTYGAQPGGEGLGDLGVLFELERSLASQPIPTSVIRPAYYLSNWDAALETARQEGVVRTFYPADFALPMVAPSDIGELAARLLVDPATGVRTIEGPERYTSNDVAAAFAEVLGKPVHAETIPRASWLQVLSEKGFSRASAESFAAMTDATLRGTFPQPDVRGKTTLRDYVRELAQAR